MTSARKHLPVVHPDERYEENYAARKAVADAQRAELDAAIAAIGPGREAYCKWILFDKLGIEPPRISYGYADGSGWQGRPPMNDERVERMVVRFVTESGIAYEVHSAPIDGVIHYPFRWSLGFQALDVYRPQPPAVMKAAAERRLAKALEEQAEKDREHQARAELQPMLPGLDGAKP